MQIRSKPKPPELKHPEEVIRRYTSIYGLTVPENLEYRRLLGAKILEQARASKFISDILLSRGHGRKGDLTRRQKASIDLIYAHAPSEIKKRLGKDPRFDYFFKQMARQLTIREIYLEEYGPSYFSAFYNNVKAEFDLMQEVGFVSHNMGTNSQIPVFDLADKVAKGVASGLTKGQVLKVGNSSTSDLVRKKELLAAECTEKYPQYKNLHRTAISLVMKSSYETVADFFRTYEALKKEAKEKYPGEKTDTPVYLVLTKRYKSLSDYYVERKKYISELAEALPDCSSHIHSTFASLLLRNVYLDVESLVRKYTQLWIEFMDYNIVVDRDQADEIVFSVLKKDLPTIKMAIDRFLKLSQVKRKNRAPSLATKVLTHRTKLFIDGPNKPGN
ncbi:MAG: hypothetical protein PHH82_03125 [Candidatus ainarchaeum sp.]|nr:hypothetical protein [Candidatus ainarchaeum sp.]